LGKRRPTTVGYVTWRGGGHFSAVAVSREGVSNIMLWKTLTCGVVLACGAVALGGLSAAADDKRGDKPALSGTWAKKGGELKIEFAHKGGMKIVPHSDSAVIAILCDYTVEKDELVKVKVTGFEGKDEAKKHVAEVVPVGLKFRFNWRVKGDAAKLDDLKGDNVETLKSHLEGDFEQKK
jgi:hypothetical protein